MIEEQSLCHHCEHGRPENWCAEFGIDMQMVESCSAFSKATEKSNSSSMACYDALKQQIETLRDQLHSGIKYDEKMNAYVVCWTEKQIEDAKREADELLSKIKWLPEAS